MIKKIIGWSLILLPPTIVFLLCFKKYGFWVPLLVWVIIWLVAAMISIGFDLIFDE
jgi:hypothetical protein